jgi:hypothetical protein
LVATVKEQGGGWRQCQKATRLPLTLCWRFRGREVEGSFVACANMERKLPLITLKGRVRLCSRLHLHRSQMLSSRVRPSEVLGHCQPCCYFFSGQEAWRVRCQDEPAVKLRRPILRSSPCSYDAWALGVEKKEHGLRKTHPAGAMRASVPPRQHRRNTCLHRATIASMSHSPKT